MVIEQLIFTIMSFAIFVYMFFRMIQKNDTTYVIILVLEAFGISLNFAEVLFGVELNIIFIMLKYIFSILLPILIMILEKRNMSLFEILFRIKAQIYLFFNNTRKAKQTLLDILDKNQNSYKAHLMLAQIYEQEGGMRKSIDEYVQAIDLNKQDYNSYYKVSELLNQLEKKDEAAQMLFNLLQKKPDMCEASELLGSILIEKDRYKEASNVYQDAIKYNPLNYELHYNLAIVYTMLNDFQSAKMYYEKAAEINSLSYNSIYSLAQIALIYKELEEAERRFLSVIEEDELSADAYYELAKISLLKREKDVAIKYINIAIDIDSKKIVEKVKKDSMFIPIMAKISIPFNLESDSKESKGKMTKKEEKVKEHLEEICELTRNLSDLDIKKLNKNESGKTKKIEDKKQKKSFEKEIQE